MALSETPIDLDKMRSIGYLSKGQTRNKVKEGKDNNGQRYKATTDELNNTVTERSGDRQDVLIRAPHLKKTTRTEEER